MKCFLKKDWSAFGMNDQIIGDVNPDEWKTAEIAEAHFGNGRTCLVSRNCVHLVDIENDIESAKSLLEAHGYEVSSLTKSDLTLRQKAREHIQRLEGTLKLAISRTDLGGLDGNETESSDYDDFIKLLVSSLVRLQVKN